MRPASLAIKVTYDGLESAVREAHVYCCCATEEKIRSTFGREVLEKGLRKRIKGISLLLTGDTNGWVGEELEERCTAQGQREDEGRIRDS